MWGINMVGHVWCLNLQLSEAGKHVLLMQILLLLQKVVSQYVKEINMVKSVESLRKGTGRKYRRNFVAFPRYF